MPRLEYSRSDVPITAGTDPAALPPLLPDEDRLIQRFTIASSDRSAIETAWETILPKGRAIVVSSPVRPRVAEIDPAFPFRIVATEPATRDFVLGINQLMIALEAVVAGSAPLESMEQFLRSNRWATADILHVAEPLPELPLRTSAKAPPGTAGWLLRMADLWQTRLIVLEYDGIAPPLLRRLAATVLDHGGPAVVIVPRGGYHEVYWSFVHDRPLDWTAAKHGYLLFAGEGREELLRYSKIPEQLARPEVIDEIAPVVVRRTGRPKKEVLKTLREASSEVRTKLATTEFEFSEGRGMNPSKATIDAAFRPSFERLTRITMPTPPVFDGGRPAARPAAAKTAPERPARKTRHVNSAFFRRDAEGEMVQAAQDACFTAGQPVHLGIQIGPRDQLVKTVGRTALVEEKFRWQERKKENGVSVEVAVTGIDFDVLGAAVQQLWLPRAGATDRLFFTVSPRTTTTIPGVARLRFSLFFENNLVQSYRVAALTAPSSGAASLLGRALDVQETDVPHGVAWLATIEYANAPLNAVRRLPPRGLTVIANESAGEKVFTIKGEELFHVTINNDVPSLIADMRSTLQTLSAEESAPSKYRFRFGKVDNAGDPDELPKTLFSIANLGWQLYSAIVNDAGDRAEVDRILGTREEIIHVADVKLGDVVPWSLLYDREIDPARRTRRDTNGTVHPAARELCTVAWPDAGGNLPVKECGGPDCVLTKGKPGIGPDTVVCPLHFWGYKHQIEVPVQQTNDRKAADTAAPAPQKRTRPVKIAAAMNRKLPFHQEHEQRLTTLLATHAANAVLDGQILDDRDSLKDVLGTAQPDIVYLYCHAFPRKQLADGTTSGPNLGFGDETDETALIAAPNLTGDVWRRKPLVFLNGCSTVGFNPSTPSPFVVQFVRTRQAGAVIGTEVTVWEILAAEMAEQFLDAFLRNAPAGDALRKARRLLLRKNNPLGLVYTLYGKADVTL